MPPRYAYWTILIDGAATAFRAREREELLPTFNQLRRKNTDVALRYFSRGKLWDSPEQAEWAGRNAHHVREPRSAEWRPGGEHKDPRARFDKKPKRPREDRPADRREADTRRQDDIGRPDRPPRRDSWKPQAPRDDRGRDARQRTDRPRDSRPGAECPRENWSRDDRRPAPPRGKAGWKPKPRGDWHDRDQHARDSRPREERPRESRARDERPRDSRPPKEQRSDWSRDERRPAPPRGKAGWKPKPRSDWHDRDQHARDSRPREERPRESRARDERPRDNRPPKEQRSDWSHDERRPAEPRGKAAWKPKPRSDWHDRDQHARDTRPREERPRDSRRPQERRADSRPRDERRPPENRGKSAWAPKPRGDWRSRDERPRDRTPREETPHGGRPRDERARDNRPRDQRRPAAKPGSQARATGWKPKRREQTEDGTRNHEPAPHREDWRKRPDQDDAAPRPPREGRPDRPPAPEQIVTKPEPPERG